MLLLFGLPVLTWATWGCAAMIAAAYGINLFPRSTLHTDVLTWLAPWIAVPGGFLLWRQARLWRSLAYVRAQPLPLSRNPAPQIIPPSRPSGLERAGRFTMMVGAAALLYWFEVRKPEYVLVAALLLWMFKGLVFGTFKRQLE